MSDNNLDRHYKKARRLDSVQTKVHDEQEIIRRFPEIDAIYDDAVREDTIEYFKRACPDYFWERPASSSGEYHPPDESLDHSTWLHSKRVFYEYANLSESLLELQEIDSYQRSCGKAAALIHDTFNYGWPSDNRDMTTSEHDVIAAAVCEYTLDMPDEVICLVETHMGPWGSGPEPTTKNEMCFHFADKSAAAPNHTQKVYYPAEELREIDSVQEAEVDEDGFV